MVHDPFYEQPDSSWDSSDWTAAHAAATIHLLKEEADKFQFLGGVGTMTANRNSVFLAAFWAGLASPVSVYAAPAQYSAYMCNYSLPLSFAQVGLALSHSYAYAIDDGSIATPTADTESVA